MYILSSTGTCSTRRSKMEDKEGAISAIVSMLRCRLVPMLSFGSSCAVTTFLRFLPTAIICTRFWLFHRYKMPSIISRATTSGDCGPTSAAQRGSLINFFSQHPIPNTSLRCNTAQDWGILLASLLQYKTVAFTVRPKGELVTIIVLIWQDVPLYGRGQRRVPEG